MSKVLPMMKKTVEYDDAWFDEQVRLSKDDPVLWRGYATLTMIETLLRRNENNRRIKVNKTKVFARDMLEGRWIFNGDTFRVEKTSRFIDGQNRLTAMKRALEAQPDLLIEMAIWFGLDERAQKTIDTGTPRNAADVFAQMGWQSATVLKATCAMILAALRGEESYSFPSSVGEMLELLNDHPSVFESVEFGMRNYKHAPLSKTRIAFCHWWLIYRGCHRPDVEDFMTRMATGAHLEGPLLVVNQRLQLASSLRSKSLSAFQIVGFVFKAWNAHINDERPRHFTTPEKRYPEILNRKTKRS